MAALLLVIGSGARLPAQEVSAGEELYRPHLTISMTGAARARAEDFGGEFGSLGGFADATFPLGTAGSVRFLGRFRLGAESADFGFLGEKRTLYAAQAGLTAGLRAGEKDSLIFSAMPSIAEDEHTVSSPRLRFAGAILGVHRSSDELLFDYGLVYSYIYGRGRLLPALGIRWTPQSGWIVSALLPVAVSVRRRAGSSASVGLIAGPLGERVRFQNTTEFPGQPSIVNFRLRQYRIAAEAALAAGPRVSVHAEAGALVGRKISFANGDTDFVESSLKTAPYARLSLRFAFGGETPGMSASP